MFGENIAKHYIYISRRKQLYCTRTFDLKSLRNVNIYSPRVFSARLIAAYNYLTIAAYIHIKLPIHVVCKRYRRWRRRWRRRRRYLIIQFHKVGGRGDRTNKTIFERVKSFNRRESLSSHSYRYLCILYAYIHVEPRDKSSSAQRLGVFAFDFRASLRNSCRLKTTETARAAAIVRLRRHLDIYRRSKA